ncbi:helix-turn-helix domain-containing protein [Streptococcus canis]|uniref:helix-turn-helix domain-containing protein n=1 Tax=Streptococcus TaxID=1301 RepID=UPI0010C262C1|nr:hypothetical protein Javan91_0007 [Streptococcus phage Javan91]QBX31944.1 hypothetical protein Javan88_0009 [Streptococcus phage Javan88]
MELEFIWRLAHQLDKETFLEVYNLIDNPLEIGETENLLDLLEKTRKSNLETMDEMSAKFGVSKQAYKQWQLKGNLPSHHVRKAAEIIGLDNMMAIERNFIKEYKRSNTNSITLLERQRLKLGIGKKEFAKMIGCDVVTYRNWRKANHIPDSKLKDISDVLDIELDLLIEANFVD